MATRLDRPSTPIRGMHAVPPPPPPPAFRTAGRRWRMRRNLVIFLASRNGVSQRVIADVFDLARSRVAAIIEEYREKYAL